MNIEMLRSVFRHFRQFEVTTQNARDALLETIDEALGRASEPEAWSWSVDALRAVRALSKCTHERYEVTGEITGGLKVWCSQCGARNESAKWDNGESESGLLMRPGDWRRPGEVQTLVQAYEGKAAKV